LRSNEYFGQYGKITKILLVKRNSPGGGGPVVGLYITYHRREDAARAIAAVDGTSSPGGGREVMRASYGTTKYCMAFLRGVQCSDHSCMNLHEWGDEKDCFTKEDLATLQVISFLSKTELFIYRITSESTISKLRKAEHARSPKRRTRMVSQAQGYLQNEGANSRISLQQVYPGLLLGPKKGQLVARLRI